MSNWDFGNSLLLGVSDTTSPLNTATRAGGESRIRMSPVSRVRHALSTNCSQGREEHRGEQESKA